MQVMERASIHYAYPFWQTDTTGNQFLHLGGPQLQHRAIPGFMPEQIPAGAHFPNSAACQYRSWFLDAVPDAALIALADENDANGDGISGRPNWITIPSYAILRPKQRIVQNGKYIGRFGKKAAVYDLLHKPRMPITRIWVLLPPLNHSIRIADCQLIRKYHYQTVHDVVFYLQTLKAPVQRNQNDPDVQ